MTDLVISADGLGKRYRLGSTVAGYGRLTESLTRAATAPIRRLRGGEAPQRSREHLWALRDVSFDIERGEVVGIVGRNGAGKSTLLKLLSRVTAPTEGSALVRGRVGSLLEVGTGFHPELTGRENIFLNGAILGMRRAEIRRQFDDIVAFSEIERFLDTPVKRYSSGMYLRLAFAVAAHLQTEVLIVDEVLAVGDAAFQKKCLGKMSDVASAGRTVLFVSHNLTAVKRMCDRTILLESGRVVADGPSTAVIQRYLSSEQAVARRRTWSAEEAPGDEVARLRSITVADATGETPDSFDIRAPINVTVEYDQLDVRQQPSVGIHVWNDEGVHLFASHDFVSRDWARPREPGVVRSQCHIPGNFFAEGRFFITMTISTFSPSLVHHVVETEVLAFEVIDRSDGDGVRGRTGGDWPGVVRPMLEWHIEEGADRAFDTAAEQTKGALR